MNRNYIFLTVLMTILAAGTMVLSSGNEHKQIDPDQLLWEIIQPTRYKSTDQVAKLIIQKDPSILLIDVRSTEDYDKFSLPNSINIPIDSLMNTNSLNYFDIPGMNVVFVSIDDIKADQAWVITKRLGFKSTYVMKGGLNKWIETIIQPKEPGEEDPAAAFETYQFRKGAQLYFTGAKIESTTSTKKSKVVIPQRKKVRKASGGC